MSLITTERKMCIIDARITKIIDFRLLINILSL